MDKNSSIECKMSSEKSLRAPSTERSTLHAETLHILTNMSVQTHASFLTVL